MIPRITAVLTRLNTDGAAHLQPDALMAGCQEAGYPSGRDRVLTPVTTLQLFLSATLQHLGVERISFVEALRCLGASSTGVP
jgi:hypothetical protein